MSTSDRIKSALHRGHIHPTAAKGRHLPWTIYAVGALVTIEAIVMLEHARRLVTGIVTSEETLGLAALGPLDREVPAVAIEAFVALGLVIAAYAITRRSRLALTYVATVQAVMLVDALFRIAQGLALLPTLVVIVLACATAALVGTRPTRAWCDEPILLGRGR
jgi:hypothetical protein